MDDVSRETPPVPESVRGVFSSETLPLVERYAALLASDGVTRGLIGPREVPRLWDRHLVNCALVAGVVPPGATVADVGSGAGLPGLVLALVRPDLTVTLIEPLLRRTTFLEEVVEELDLARVDVVRGRAEALHGERRFDVVTSRAVAPLGKLARWCLPLVSPTGQMLAMKGSSVVDEIEAAQDELSAAGAAPPQVVTVGSDPDSQVTLVAVRWSEPDRVSWPTSGHRAGPRGRSRARQQR